MTHDIGKGDAQILVKMMPTEDGSLALDVHDGLPTTSFAHLVLDDILQDVATAKGVRVKEINELELAMFHFHAEKSDDESLGLRKGAVANHETLSCHVRQAMPRNKKAPTLSFGLRVNRHKGGARK